MDVTEVVTAVLAGLGTLAAGLAIVAPLTPTKKDDEALTWLQKGLTLAQAVFQARKGIGTSPKEVQARTNADIDKLKAGADKIVKTIEDAKRAGKLGPQVLATSKSLGGPKGGGDGPFEPRDPPPSRK